MQRIAESFLLAWKAQPDRKPLVVRGARQVGKSHLVATFGRAQFANVVTLNFERDPRAELLFARSEVAEIIRLVEAYARAPIRPGETLLFLDEIQAAPKVLAMLRYFAEDLPGLHVIAAGSLLDFVLAEHEFSMPVGRVSYLHLEPMTFEEVLRATGGAELVDYLAWLRASDDTPPPIHTRLLDDLGTHLLVGGMPAVVNAWRETRSLTEVQRVQFDLLATLRDDFAKYRRRVDVDRLRKVFDALPRLVARKFVAAQVDREDRSGPIKAAFRLLCLARLATPVRRSACNGIPLGAEVDPAYAKVCLLDVGLYTALCGLDATALLGVADVTLVNQGQLAEQLVGQELRAARPLHQEPELYCWVREQRTASAEVDYVIQHGGAVVPVEVKAGATGRLRSLQLFLREKGRSLGVRVGSGPASVVDTRTSLPDGEQVPLRLLSVPLYAVGQLERLLAEVRGEDRAAGGGRRSERRRPMSGPRRRGEAQARA